MFDALVCEYLQQQDGERLIDVKINYSVKFMAMKDCHSTTKRLFDVFSNSFWTVEEASSDCNLTLNSFG